MRRLLLTILLMTAAITAAVAQESVPRKEVTLITDSGTIRIALYNETPLHRDNFLKLVREGFYDGLLFHRVIYNFMIQAGDPKSKNAQKGELLGDGSPDMEDIPAEIVYPKLFHKRGCIAAAREDDSTNPERKSSASQFYIVWGKRMNDSMLDDVQERLDKNTGGTVKMTPEIREAYYKSGGTPHLDGQYTVFGEVIEGLSVVDKIQFVDVDENDRPKEDIRIIRAYVSDEE